MFNNLIPYSDIHELNLDWIIKKVREYVEKTDKLEINFDDLKSYVTNYFDNLNVQNEINVKLEEMYENGELSDIIQEYLQVSSLLTYNTISDLKNATNLIDGVDALTLGNINYLDGETYLFKIRTLTSGDVVDEINIYALTNYPTLIAEKLKSIDKGVYVNIKDLGAINDGIFDNSDIINDAIDEYRYIYIPGGTYYMAKYMDLKDNTHIISNNATILYDENTIGYLTAPVRFTKIFNIKNVSINNLTFKAHFKESVYTTDNKFLLVGISENSENIELNNCKFISSSDSNINNMGCNVWISLDTNKFISIKNSYFENLTDQSEGGCLWVFGNQKNIYVENCEFYNTCFDENVVAWGVDSSIYPEMTMENCRIIQSETSTNIPSQALMTYAYGVIHFNNGYITSSRRVTQNIIRTNTNGILNIFNTVIDFYGTEWWQLLLIQGNATLNLDNCVINYTKDSTSDRLLIFNNQGGKLNMNNCIINMEFLQSASGVIFAVYQSNNAEVNFTNNKIYQNGNISQNLRDFVDGSGVRPKLINSYNNIVVNNTSNAITMSGYGTAVNNFKDNNNIVNGTIGTTCLLF